MQCWTEHPLFLRAIVVYFGGVVLFEGMIITRFLQGNPAPSKKNVQEIPTPQFNVVETYERDYTRTFAQPTCYIRGRGGFFLVAALELAFLHLHYFVYGLYS